MKKLFMLMLVAAALACGKTDEPSDESTKPGASCGSHNGKSLNRGPEGGCYYINSNGNKTYVDRSECKC